MKGAVLKTKLLTVILAILMAALGGCYRVWRPTWWRFYERGLSHAAEEKSQEAAEDFETAVGKRKGVISPRREDARRAPLKARVRTYGLHFIDEYFPHRELGVAYYRMERFTEAERELMISLEQAPSGKAAVYLNLVRKELLLREPAQEEPPALTLKVPDKPYLSTERMTLTGTAESKNRVSSIFVNGERLLIELAEQKTEFSRDLRLKPGANKVLVEALDLIGKSSQKELLLNVDIQYPSLGIRDAVRKAADTVTLSGVATDNVGISELILDGRRQALERPLREIEFNLDAALGDTVTVEASDLAGNTTSTEVPISADMLQPVEEGLYNPILLAMSDTGRVADSGGMGLRLSQAAVSGDRKPPDIRIKDERGRAMNLSIRRIIYDDQFLFGVGARDYGRLASLTVNGEDILFQPDAINYEMFYPAYLEEGLNRFTLVAIDKAGNRAEKSFEVISQTPPRLDRDLRMTLALLELHKQGTGEHGFNLDHLLGISFDEPGRFNIVERGTPAFEEVLRELGYSAGGIADPEWELRPGRIRSAEGILWGRATEGSRSINIYLKLVDTETSDLIFQTDVHGTDELWWQRKDRSEFKWLTDLLVLKFRMRFPLVEGKVTEVTESGVSVDNGLRDGIRSGIKYLIFKENQPLKLASGRNLEARAQDVEQETCFAAFLDRIGLPEVKAGYEVITK